MDLVNIPLSRLNIERANVLVACTIRLGMGEFLTSCSICSFSRTLCLYRCSVSSHSLLSAHFSFLRQHNKDPSVICHFSDVSSTTTEMISRDASFFSRGGCKCTPLRSYGTVASRPPLEMHLQGRVTAPPAPENRAHFQGRVVPSPTPKDQISRGGRCHQPPQEMRSIFRGGWWHQPLLENHF